MGVGHFIVNTPYLQIQKLCLGESKVFWTWNLPWLGFFKVDKVGLNAYSRHKILNGGILNMKAKNRLLVAYIKPMWNVT